MVEEKEAGRQEVLNDPSSGYRERLSESGTKAWADPEFGADGPMLLAQVSPPIGLIQSGERKPSQRLKLPRSGNGLILRSMSCAAKRLPRIGPPIRGAG